MKQPVILDCDGVLLDWETGFRNWVLRHRPTTVFASEYPSDWDLSHWIGCSSDESMALIQGFNQSAYFGSLGSMPGAARTLYELERLGHPLFVVTSCSSDPVTSQRRSMNLSVMFAPRFQRVICLDLGVSKLETLRAFQLVYGECVWVEDNLKNALDGFTAGHRSFFLHRPHNHSQWHLAEKGFSPVTHLENLLDLVSLIK